MVEDRCAAVNTRRLIRQLHEKVRHVRENSPTSVRSDKRLVTVFRVMRVLHISVPYVQNLPPGRRREAVFVPRCHPGVRSPIPIEGPVRLGVE